MKRPDLRIVLLAALLIAWNILMLVIFGSVEDLSLIALLIVIVPNSFIGAILSTTVAFREFLQ